MTLRIEYVSIQKFTSIEQESIFFNMDWVFLVFCHQHKSILDKYQVYNKYLISKTKYLLKKKNSANKCLKNYFFPPVTTYLLNN